MSSSQLHPRSSQHDLPGRLVALLVFLIGVAMLVYVFVIALHLFQSPVPGLELPVKAGSASQPVINIGAVMAVFARRLLLLGVMTLAGSLLASKGAHLYFGTIYPPNEPAPNPAASGKNGSTEVQGHAGAPPTASAGPSATGE